MPRITREEEQELIDRIDRGDDDPDTWEELPPSSPDDRSASKRLGAVVSVRLDPELAEALSREAERSSEHSCDGPGLPATTEQAMRRTHARYLKSLAELATIDWPTCHLAVDGYSGGGTPSAVAKPEPSLGSL
jgi:hypothetical protein